MAQNGHLIIPSLEKGGAPLVGKPLFSRDDQGLTLVCLTPHVCWFFLPACASFTPRMFNFSSRA